MKKMLLGLAVLLFLVPAVCQARPLDVGVVVGLLDAGVSDTSIQRYVERNGFSFDLSAEDLVALKKAGASDALIAFLQDREGGSPPATSRDRAESSQGTSETMEYGVTSAVPSYSFGIYYGYPYYYDSWSYSPYSYYGSNYYYPYYGSGYYYPYYGYNHYPYYGGGHGGSGSGVVSYWHNNQPGRGSARPPASGSPPSVAPRGSPSGGRGGGHSGGSGGGRSGGSGGGRSGGRH
jgi:uncharacterized membrane protein YgcG